MLVAICHNAIPDDAREDERDVLVQASAVAQALDELGHQSELVPIGLNLELALESLEQLKPALLFNLVESFAGSDRLASVAVAALEQLALPITGSNADVLWVSNNKILAKQRLTAANLPTPAWCEIVHGQGTMSGGNARAFVERSRYIIKPVSEHASLGMDASSVVQPSNFEDLVERLRQRMARFGRPCFAEQYIDGREFNISLLASAEGCEVLPLAETDFSDFQPGQPLSIITLHGSFWIRRSNPHCPAIWAN
jgi:D-alanine-D-alanine ligase